MNKSKINFVTKISIFSIILNLLLSVAKIITGNLLSSLSIVSDGLHGLGDMVTTIIALITVIIANKAADSTHNSGHKRFGAIGSLVLSVILFVLAITITEEAIRDLITCDYSLNNKLDITQPLVIATIVILGISLITKEVMFHLLNLASKKTKSGALKADAWHQRIDALASIGALLSIVAEIFGVHFVDAIFSLLIVGMILHVAYEVFAEALKQLTGHCLPKQEVEQIKKVFTDEDIELLNLKTYYEGNSKRIQATIKYDGSLENYKAITSRIKEKLVELDKDYYEITIEL